MASTHQELTTSTFGNSQIKLLVFHKDYLTEFQIGRVTIQHIKELLNKAGKCWTLLRVGCPT